MFTPLNSIVSSPNAREHFYRLGLALNQGLEFSGHSQDCVFEISRSVRQLKHPPAAVFVVDPEAFSSRDFLVPISGDQVSSLDCLKELPR